MVAPSRFVEWVKRPLRPSLPHAGRWLIAITIGLALSALYFPWGSNLQACAGLVGLAVFVMSAALLRPRHYWGLMRQSAFADLVGDRAAVMLWLLFSLWVLSVGIRCFIHELHGV
jgi:hypothetical protein